MTVMSILKPMKGLGFQMQEEQGAKLSKNDPKKHGNKAAK